MKRALKIVGLMAVVGSLGFAGQAFANCQNEGPYEVIQCGNSTWFAPPPAGSGTVSSQWWQLGFGNATNVSDAAGVKGNDGSGFYYYAGYTPEFLGNDSGTAVLDMAPGSVVGGPPGSLCFSSAANWAAPGVDGCADNNRLSTTVPGIGTPAPSDGFMNRYFAGTTPGVLRYNFQLDAPMATLLTESNGLSFALAFFATTSRSLDSNDLSSGGFVMGNLTNGDPNPANPSRLNVVPWQPVPQPNITATFVDPNNTTSSDRILAVSWAPIRVVSDDSTRKCRNLNNTADCSTLGTLAGSTVGVGVLNQGPLAHYSVEKTALNAANGTCGTVWTSAGQVVDQPGNNTSVTVSPNTCVRLRTSFGRTPQVIFDALGSAPAMWDAAVRGKLGDIGYGVTSRATKVGGPLVSQKAVLNVADRNKNAVTVAWDTTTELNITGFDIVGIDQKGGKKVLASASCKSCTTGLGQSYTQVLSSGQVKDSKKIQVVIKPTGEASNILDLK